MIPQELKAIGDTLKQRRKERNISLREVENGTSIRMGYLQAIEEGSILNSISSIYAQGFIRQYANFLGLDADLLLRENAKIFQREIPQDFSYGIGTFEKRGNPGSGVKWVPNALWVILFAFVLLLAWYFARYLDII